MKSTDQNHLLHFIDIRQVSYYLFINDKSIEFIKITGKKSFTVLLKKEYTIFSQELFSEYLSQLQTKSYLFGQPISIILNLSSTYLYTKQMQDTQMSEIQNSIKLLSDKNYDVKFSIYTKKKIKLFVYQAVKKTLIDTVIKCVENQKLNCLQIATLQSLLVNQTIFSSEKNFIYNFTLFNNKYHLLKKNNDIVCYNDKHSNIESLIETIISGREYNTYTIKSTALILSKFHNSSFKKLSYSTKSSQKSTYQHTAYNSLKLLSRVALLTLFLLGIITGVSSLLSSESNIISEYQQKYTQKQLIQDQIDSLQNLIARSTKDRLKTIHAGSILSMFCQKSYNKLFLTKISINNKFDDYILVEAIGYAKNEDLIFKYQNTSTQYTAPYKLSLNRIKPEITNSRGLVDTNITFGFTMVIDQ